MIKQKKILVVGGTGFLGFHLCREAIKKNWLVTSISSKKPLAKKKIQKVKYLICDIAKKNQIKLLDKNYDYVVNFGGYVDHSNNKKTYKSHYLGCKNLADFFLNKKIRSFIQIGSSIEYGFHNSPQDENFKTSVEKLKSIYGKSKLLATEYLLNLYKTKKFPATILRLYLVYGPHQDVNRLIPITINGCLKNLNFDCSAGNQKRDFVYISDVIDVIFKSLKSKNAKGEIFNIGTGKSIRIKKIIQSINKFIKKGKPHYGKIELRKDEILNLYPNIKKVKKILKWSPKVEFYRGLKKTINYYKSLK